MRLCTSTIAALAMGHPNTRITYLPVRILWVIVMNWARMEGFRRHTSQGCPHLMKVHKGVWIAGIVLAVLGLSTIPGYFVAKWFFERHFNGWGEKLVDLERRGLLSTRFGAAWQDVLTGQAMHDEAAKITEPDSGAQGDTIAIVDGVRIDDYPSLSLVARLNEIHVYSNTIEITDRKERQVALIRTDHTRGKLEEFPRTLIAALIAAEDEHFWTNDLGFEFRSYVRAAVDAVKRSVFSFRLRTPKGTSTITQQVAKLFISHLDEQGRRYVSRSVDRKLREMRIAAALRKMYTPEEILEVYLNHCVTSDYGLIGYKDIALGLFDKQPKQLTDAECVYLSRMVKWGRNLRYKIIQQCHIDMPRIAAALQWDKAKQDSIFAELDSLTFKKPKRIVTEQGILVDCANEYWMRVLRRNGASDERMGDFDIIDPNSLIRKKGNLTIQLTVDLPLQRALEKLVDARGYGPDTTILTEARIGSFGEDVTLGYAPEDTLRHIEVLSEPRTFSEPGSSYEVTLDAGDSLITNIRYNKKGNDTYRRSCFYYAPRLVKVDGQYYAYAAIDSRTGKLLAYYSRDRIGSRLAGLLDYRTPNGSSTAKPIFNALNFDLGVFRPYDTWTDTTAVHKDVPWRRKLEYYRGRPIGVVFEKSAVRGKGYHVHNHGYIFEGCNYIFDHLATSNNIFAVETCYRLDRRLFDPSGAVLPDAFPLVQYFYRMGALTRIKEKLKRSSVTGVRVYKELVRVLGVDVDTTMVGDTPRPISDSLYSVALGTMELSLLEQLHLFNVLYDNNLVERPAEHPSLFVESIVLNNHPIPVDDTVKLYHPFADINNLRPTYLGMHKRLVSNRWDGLQ
ncbi:MAG: hypothetical protein GF331_05795, partial [Chitinivibrionales bacterium]|nr:hypothetical protein [Chitinivibrionales bacterium]